MELKSKSRVPGLDIIRSLAAFSVVAVHFYLNCGYYQTPMSGTKMFIMTFVRWALLWAVPFFMMLTGYLKCNKTVSLEHYLSLLPILVAYVSITVIKVIVSNHFYGKIYFFKDTIKGIANYSFAWYVSMYICMILLIPFLNILWKGLKSDREKIILILSLIFICSLPTVIPYLVPAYLQTLYPVMYYYIGVFIREKKPEYNKLLLTLIVFIMALINSLASYIGAKGGFFDWNVLSKVDSGYQAFPLVIGSVAAFLIFYDIDVKNTVVRRLFELISGVSFEIYMFTGVFDAVIYSIAYRYIAKDANLFFWYFFIFVPLNFILSILASKLYRLLYDQVSKGVIKLMKKKENDK